MRKCKKGREEYEEKKKGKCGDRKKRERELTK